MFIDDIIFYQRPLKSKKSTIANCSYETKSFIRKLNLNGTEKEVRVDEALKGISQITSTFSKNLDYGNFKS
ncbi:MAG: hypothetical protein R2728_10205 [Chitinophagales bacterium]